MARTCVIGSQRGWGPGAPRLRMGSGPCQRPCIATCLHVRSRPEVSAAAHPSAVTGSRRPTAAGSTRCPSHHPGISPAAVEVWDGWFRAWWAGSWTPDDLPSLRFVVPASGTASTGVMSSDPGEFRQWMDGYGLRNGIRHRTRDRLDHPPRLPVDDECLRIGQALDGVPVTLAQVPSARDSPRRTPGRRAARPRSW